MKDALSHHLCNLFSNYVCKYSWVTLTITFVHIYIVKIHVTSYNYNFNGLRNENYISLEM